MKTKKFIEVYDDIIPQYLQDGVEKLVFSEKIQWGFREELSGSIKNPSVTPFYGFVNNFHYAFGDDYPDNYQINSYLAQVLYKLAFYVPFDLKTILKGRLFLQTPHPDARVVPETIHTDLPHPHWVCLYYVNNAKGDTAFYNDKKEEIKRVSPKKGRIVFFDGSIMHAGCNPSSLRSIINFDFIGEKL